MAQSSPPRSTRRGSCGTGAPYREISRLSEEATKEGEDEDGEREREAPVASSPPKKTLANPNNRTDHLGVPIRPFHRQKYRYARTYTVMYDAENERDKQTEIKQYKLLQHARRVIDISTAGLHRLFVIFNSAAPHPDQSLVGPVTFRLALAKHGVRDDILTQRLFAEFCSTVYLEKIDYRAFVRILASVNDASCEDKIALLFDVWDIDLSGKLSHDELCPIVLAGLPTNEMEAIMTQFNKVWAEIRFNLESGTESGRWIGLSRNWGVTKETLCEACAQLPRVREFFSRILARRPPKAEERAHHNFQLRIRELEAEVHKEIRMKDHRKEEKKKQQEQDEVAVAEKRLKSLNFVDRLAHSKTMPNLQRTYTFSKGFGFVGKSQNDAVTAYKAKANNVLSRRQRPVPAGVTPTPTRPGSPSPIQRQRARSVVALPPLAEIIASKPTRRQSIF